MPLSSIVCGTLLVLIGAIGYIYGVMNDKASITALIPAFFGVVIFLLGVVSRSSEGLRKHLMHAAMVIALIGFILPAARVVSKLGEISLSPAIVSQVAMAAVCLLLVVLGIRSFREARLNR